MNKKYCDEILSQERKRVYLEHTRSCDTLAPFECDYIVIAYIAYGSGTATIANKKRVVKENDLFIFNPKTSIFFENDEVNRMEIYYCCFYTEFLNEQWQTYRTDFPEISSFLNRIGSSYLYIKDDAKLHLRDFIIRMIDEYMNNKRGYLGAIKGYLLAFLPSAFRQYTRMPNKEIFSQNRLVDETIKCIHQHIYTTIAPHEIAARRCVSLEHLGRVFKKHTGMTITQYTNELKVKKAADILKNTDRTIERIADLLDYRTTYLQHLFKKHMGMSMSEYRKQYHYKN
jgi:AraC-like DNA-binding protein